MPSRRSSRASTPSAPLTSPRRAPSAPPPLTPSPFPSLYFRYGDKLSRCFREIDGDGSGKADRAEVLRLIKIYAPSSRDVVLENVVDFGDYDGEGEVRRRRLRRPAAALAPRPRTAAHAPPPSAPPAQVSFAEFARVVTTDDILNMKKTLSAVEVKTNKYGEVEEAVDHRREIDKQWEAERLKQWDAFANPDN